MNTETATAKCPCQNCDGHIAFDPAAAGQTITCPHCGMDTLLSRPADPAPPAAPVIKPAPAVLPARPKRSEFSLLGPAILALLGLGLVLSGCAAESHSESAMQQTLAAIQYCTGFIVLGLAFLLDGIGMIVRKP